MQNKKLVVFVAVLALSVLSTGMAAAATWSTAQLLNDPSETSCKDPHCYPASGGGFHLLYKYAPDGGAWQIRYRRYYQSLGSRYNIPNTAWPGGLASITQALDGTIWAAWENWADGNEQIYAARSTDGGQSWTSYNVTQYYYPPDRGGEAKTPQLAPYGTGSSPNIMIAHWQAYEKDLKYNTWNGAVMSAVGSMSVTTDNQYAVTGICRSPYDGSVYRTYGRKINGVWQICYKRWDGSSWGPEVQVSTNTGSDFVARPAIAVNALNQIMVVWDQVNSVWYRFYDPAQGWSPQGTIGDGYRSSVTAIPGTASFYIVYCPVNRPQNYVYGRRFIYGQWDEEELVSTGFSFGYTTTPEICADSTGKLMCVWESWPNGAPQMYYSICNDFTVQDTTPPVFNGPVYDDGDTQDIATFLHATWNAASDPESGIHHYEYSIGTSPGSTNVCGWVNSGSDLEMVHSQAFSAGTYYINVRAMNNAGLASNVISSNGIQITVIANPMTFSSPISVESSSRACSNVALAKANDGGLHLVYDITDPYVHYRKRGADGVWGTAVGIAPGAYPSIAETTDNIIRVVFTTTTGRENLTLQESYNSGGGWSAASTIYTGMNWYPRLVRGVSGRVHLIDNAGTSHTVKYGVRNGSWSTLTDLGTSSRYGTPDMVMGTDGTLHAVWVSGNDLVYRKNVNGSWQTAQTIDTGAGYMMPRIALNNSNRPVIVWLGAWEEAGYRVMFTQWTGSAWTTPRIIGYGHYPAIAVDQNDKIHIVYTSYRGTNGKEDILHVVYNGSGWTTARNISQNNGSSMRPAIVVTNDNSVHVAWQDDSNRTNSQIFYCTSASAPTSGAIAGVVRDNNNNPIAGATVSTNTGNYSTTTAADGSYRIGNVTPGTYNVTAQKNGYTSQTQYNKTVTAGQTTTVDFNLTLVPGTIAGTVKDTNNNPLSGATVRTTTGGYSTTTNSSGQYTLSNVVPGTYSVEASKSGYLSQTQSNVQVVSNQTTTVNFSLPPNVGRIQGVVNDECGDPLGGATVQTTSGGYSTTTAADGSYTLNNVVAGTYSVVASKSGYQSQTNNNVSVTAGQTTTSNFQLAMLTEEDVLVNGSFEGGFYSFWGGSMANSWGATFRSSEHGSNCQWSAYNAGGGVGYTQRVYLNYQGGEAGIVQVVSGLTPGASFRFSAYAYQTSTNSTCWIAADPNGGTTLPSRTTAFVNTPGQWNYQQVTGTVGPSGTVTVFLWVWHQWNPAGTCYFNDARLVVTVPGSPGRISGFVRDESNKPVDGATVSTNVGGYTTTTAADGSYTLVDVRPGNYNVTASKTGYQSQTKAVTVSACTNSVCDFTITQPTEKVQNGNMEGGFWSTGWGTTCSGRSSVLPNPNDAWGWNNDPSVPFNTFDATEVRRSGSHSCGIAFCQTAPSPGKIGVIWQTVYLGGPYVSKTFTAYAYHTDGNCPSIMCWNPGISQPDPMTAYYNGRYQWITTDNWGQRYMWVGRSMAVTADSTGYVTIMVGGAAHPGTASGALLYIDDVSVQ